jgi:predicted Zn-ribbon and HTH transcriptional regulator
MPNLEKVTVMGFRCQRCGHTWVPRDSAKPPRICPKCKSPYWDRPRRAPADAKHPKGAAAKS